MSCESASNNATAPAPAIAPGAELIDIRRAAEAIATRWPKGVDDRLAALIPGFDAPFFQAGLAGYSDAAMRIIARRHGAPFCITEALLDRTLLAGGRGFAKADLGELEDNVPGGAEDHPLAGQIMGSDPREMAAAALKMVEQGRARTDKSYRELAYETPGVLPSTHASTRTANKPQHLRLPGGIQVGFWPASSDEVTQPRGDDAPSAASLRHSVTALPSSSFEVIDVNLACPVKKIDKKARGGHWLAEPEGAIAILEAVREAVPKEIPCAVKLRRSYDDTPEMIESFHKVFDACYRIGYAYTTVHARTVEQKYVGPSRWTFLKDLVQANPDKLIFGSGDVWEAADIIRMITYAGVHAVSVARGCIGNPWIFRQARDLLAGKDPRPPTLAEQRQVVLDHFELALRVNGGLGLRSHKAEIYTGKAMRKFGIRFAAHHPRAEDLRKRFIAVDSLEHWRSVVDEFYPAPAEERSSSARLG